MKFIFYVDYCADINNPYFDSGYEYEVRECDSLEEAIEIADDWYNVMTNDGRSIYLMRILKKAGAATMKNRYHSEPFTATLCKRSAGWHRNTADNAEGPHTVNLCWYGKFKGVRDWWIENTTYNT